MQIDQINTLLIANRGEIASRIIRTCRKMGIKSITIFSDADANELFVKEADRAVHIGESNPTLSYLNQDKIIAVAKQQKADAIHPGYGFLSENVVFAQRCAEEEMLFVGPNSAAIAAMGSKSKAKTLMQAHGVPTIPGYQGDDQSEATLVAAAHKIGFPLLLKATAGGGGKGMRIVHQAANLEKSIAAAKRESMAAFGDDELIIEKYIAKGRHIEFQIFGDKHGNVIHILERECTIQRRYQKVLEESPSPVLDTNLRQQMGAAAIKAAKALNYDNAGTVEFIFDDTSQEFFFLEVNTRLQVEHPVTEAVTGLDLVQLQIESAEGHPLSIQQADIQANGYALEARLYAEDPANGFRPATGTVHVWEVPQVDGLRVDTAVSTGSEISIHYDPMIAKIIIHGANRSIVHRKMAYTLRHLKCLGLTTNQDFLLQVLDNSDFQKGNYDTHFIANKLTLRDIDSKTDFQQALAAIACTLFDWKQRDNQRNLLKSLPSGWRNSPYQAQQKSYVFGEQYLNITYTYNNPSFDFSINESNQKVTFLSLSGNTIRLSIDGIHYQLTIAKNEQNYAVHSPEIGSIKLVLNARFPQKEVEKVKGGFEAPMPSLVVQVLVEEGQQVKAGDGLIIISSMKMENTIEADMDGIVEEVYATAGQSVEAGFLLLKLA